jgi:large subunit ribosomal protein L25
MREGDLQMNDNFIEALDRTGKLGKAERNSFIPGVIYGEGVEGGKPVKFNTAILQGIIYKHGSRAKVWIKIGNDQKIGVIREIQREPVSARISHVDVQIVSMEHDLKIKIPIIFHGKSYLESKNLFLQVLKSEISISGNPQSIPESVIINLEGKGANYSVTLKDINLDSSVIIHEHDTEVFAIIAEARSGIESTKAETSAEMKNEIAEPAGK